MCAKALNNYAVIASRSGIKESDLEQMFFRSVPPAQTAVEGALVLKRRDASMPVLPYAVNRVQSVTGIT